MRVALAIPTVTRPYQQTIDAVDASLPLLRAAGHTVGAVSEVGSAYISWARANMLRKALEWSSDAVVFIDHDLSWEPRDLLTLVETPGHVVGGTYRFKDDTGDYMGHVIPGDGGKPRARADGAVLMKDIPAGFLKITPTTVKLIREAHPELCCDDTQRGERYVDLFHHGAHKGVWYGEDYAFCRRWREMGGQVWCVPDLSLTHHGADGTAYPGNYHEYLLRRPGGALARDGDTIGEGGAWHADQTATTNTTATSSSRFAA